MSRARTKCITPLRVFLSRFIWSSKMLAGALPAGRLAWPDGRPLPEDEIYIGLQLVGRIDLTQPINQMRAPTSRHSLAVKQSTIIFGDSLKRMAKGMTKIQQGAVASFAFIRFDDAGLGTA